MKIWDKIKSWETDITIVICVDDEKLAKTLRTILGGEFWEKKHSKTCKYEILLPKKARNPLAYEIMRLRIAIALLTIVLSYMGDRSGEDSSKAVDEETLQKL